MLTGGWERTREPTDEEIAAVTDGQIDAFLEDYAGRGGLMSRANAAYLIARAWTEEVG